MAKESDVTTVQLRPFGIVSRQGQTGTATGDAPILRTSTRDRDESCRGSATLP